MATIIFAACGGQQTQPQKRTGGKPVASADEFHGLRADSIPLRSTAIGDGDFSDLAPFGNAVGSAKLVLLGEESHGDGTAFATKARLVRFLHEQKDFDVLAFEAPLYDCTVAWESIQRGGNLQDAAHRCLFSIWSNSVQVDPLMQYVGSQAKGPHPLEVTGFDCQTRKRGKTTSPLYEDLYALLGEGGVRGTLTEEDWTALRQILSNMNDLAYRATSVEYATSQSLFAKLRTGLASVRVSTAFSQARLDFWIRVIETTSAYFEYKWNPTSEYYSDRDAGAGRTLAYVRTNARDKEMAANLMWLASERFRGKKIVVWAASFHTMRNPSKVDTSANMVEYEHFVPMGEWLRRAMADDVYSVGFVAGGGIIRNVENGLNEPIPPPPPDSVESLASRAGLDNAVLLLRGAKGTWARETLAASPFGYDVTRATWPAIFDAFVFNKTMEPSREILSK